MHPNVSIYLYLDKLMYQSIIQLTLCTMYFCILMYQLAYIIETDVIIKFTMFLILLYLSVSTTYIQGNKCINQ